MSVPPPEEIRDRSVGPTCSCLLSWIGTVAEFKGLRSMSVLRT